MIGRVVHKVDFERLLGTPPRSRSAHFAVHHVTGVAWPAKLTRPGAIELNLSTGDAPAGLEPVHISVAGQWIGCVVPKRHAKRSVTRTLLKRQIRSAMARHAGSLAPGLWVVRLRSPFRREAFPSAASGALRRCAREELDLLFVRAAG